MSVKKIAAYIYFQNMKPLLKVLNTIKTIDIIYLKPFYASQVKGIGEYAYALKLINNDAEYVNYYTLYSKLEKDIIEWIASINSYSE